jgi:hypothetical protein
VKTFESEESFPISTAIQSVEIEGNFLDELSSSMETSSLDLFWWNFSTKLSMALYTKRLAASFRKHSTNFLIIHSPQSPTPFILIAKCLLKEKKPQDATAKAAVKTRRVTQRHEKIFDIQISVMIGKGSFLR